MVESFAMTILEFNTGHSITVEKKEKIVCLCGSDSCVDFSLNESGLYLRIHVILQPKQILCLTSMLIEAASLCQAAAY